MDKQDSCESCSQKHNCQEAYRQLGKAQGPSVVRKVVVAFLLPMVVFIASLAAFEWILTKAVNEKTFQTALSLLLALSATLAVILITNAINRRLSKGE